MTTPPIRVVMVGTGYVGLVSGTCFAELGARVVCVDSDRAKIDRLWRGDIGIYEPDLARLVSSNVAAGRLQFTPDLADAAIEAEVIFVAVGTPSRRDGHADLSSVHAVIEELALILADIRHDVLIVIKSTVPVGTCRGVENLLRGRFRNDRIHIASNPEFLREGSAIADFMRPERVVIGTGSERAREIMRALYRPLEMIETPIVFTGLDTAEMVKYASNAFLATKIAFINEIADLCEALGGDVQDVARGIGLDSRIGHQFLQPGPGFGGSCFPKDCRALVHAAEEVRAPLSIVAAVLDANERRKQAMARRIIAACGGQVAGKTIAVLGLTFKQNTDDLRDSPSLTIVPALLAAGATVRAFDPEGMDESRKSMPDLDYGLDAYDVMDGADALVLLTEWREFRHLDLMRVAGLLRRPVVVDLRNLYHPQEMAAAGLVYHSVGRALSQPPVLESAPVIQPRMTAEPDVSLEAAFAAGS